MTDQSNGHRLDLSGNQLDEWAAVAMIAIGLGLATHVLIRVLGLGWSWALVPLGLVPAVALIDPSAAAALTLGALIGTSTSFAWLRNDIERGGHEAQMARERLGVGTGLIGWLRLRRAKETRLRDERLAIGQDRRRRVATVPFGSREGRRGLVVGAPGSGKTVTTAAIATEYVAAGLPVIGLDPKRDASFRNALADAAEATGVPFFEWSHEGSAIYNPLGRGDATEIADKVLAGETWSEPHYLRQAQRYLGWALRVIEEAGEQRSLERLVDRLDPDRLEHLGERCGEETQDRLALYLDSLSSRQRADLGGVRDRLAVLAESALGRYLDPSAGTQVIDLAAAWRSRSVVYFCFDADRYPLASQMLGAAVISDLVSLTGELQRSAATGLVAIDEFAALGAREILRILSRSRSAGISVLVATQGLADLDEVDDQYTSAMTRRVLSQVDFVIAHRQPEAEAAEQLSKLGGTRPAWTRTERTSSGPGSWGRTAESTRARTREFARHPDEFKSLRRGEAILIEPAGRRRAQTVRVWTARAAERLESTQLASGDHSGRRRRTYFGHTERGVQR